MTSRGALQTALARRLGSASEARWILEDVLGAGGGAGGEVDEPAVRAISDLATRRVAGEPA